MKLRRSGRPEARHAASTPRPEVRPATTEQDLRIERTRASHLAEQHHLELVDLRTVSPDPAAAALLDEFTARNLVAVPLELRDEVVVVAVADPTVGDELQAALGRRVALMLAAPTDVLHAIGTAYRALTGIDDRVKVFAARDAVRKDVRDDAPGASEDAPVVQVVQLVITQALRDRASDVHIEPHGDRVRVRYRIDGALHDVLELPGSIGPAVVSRIKILADLNIVERRRPQDGQISMDVEGRPVDIRVATTAVVGGEKVVLRLLDKSRPLFELGQLGMPEHLATTYARLLRAPYGMVICAGPTGSGKTTTLYGSLGEINSPERNVMTIEDPVEYTFDSINQIQINEAAGITFAGGLRSILRQDPDVILVGEVRDVDTARIAVQSALTGHLVLSSLHATDAATALHRLLDMGIENFLVASSVTAVVSQRLVRRICMNCREYYQPKTEELAFLASAGGTPPPDGFVRGAGCNFCAQTGFLERTGVYELMPVTDTIRELIVDRASHDEIRKAARYDGMRTLTEEGVRLAESGITTVGEVMRSIYMVGS
ncbi:type II/IV secretion system protein [Kribbella pittospori]|uniref:Type II/IV secretion system protein n=1 Tax=Kribbella pittospori TaxID=722689 RepID=A0A4V2MAR8_9ACTN|nr:GspE/PulE family protein [Kribbella pittospori]TCC60342.1 type II/IV secretion system protein [Kribbella pittospori]